jgi:DNA-binding transcriptional regulator WhiA
MIEIVRLYKSGQSISQIAQKFGVSKTTIHKKLRQHITLRPPVCRKHQINITSITDYQTESCAYWLGYLACKSSLRDTRISVRLSQNYIRHLYKLTESLATSIMPTKKDGRCRLAINHTTLTQFYRDNGLPQFKLGDPSQIPTQKIVVRHFLRGLWDGSGIITHNSRYLRMGFSSQHPEILNFVGELLREVGVATNKIDKRGGRFYYWWSGTSAMTIAKYLYFTQTISLDRKTNRVLDYLLVKK